MGPCCFYNLDDFDSVVTFENLLEGKKKKRIQLSYVCQLVAVLSLNFDVL